MKIKIDTTKIVSTSKIPLLLMLSLQLGLSPIAYALPISHTFQKSPTVTNTRPAVSGIHTTFTSQSAALSPLKSNALVLIGLQAAPTTTISTVKAASAKVLPVISKEETEAQSIQSKAEKDQQKGDYKEAAKLFQEAAKKYQQLGNSQQAITDYQQAGSDYGQAGEPTLAGKDYNDAGNIATSSGNTSTADTDWTNAANDFNTGAQSASNSGKENLAATDYKSSGKDWTKLSTLATASNQSLIATGDKNQAQQDYVTSDTIKGTIDQQKAATDAQNGDNAASAKLYHEAGHEFKLAGQTNQSLQDIANSDQLKAGIAEQSGNDKSAGNLYYQAGHDMKLAGNSQQAQQDFAASEPLKGTYDQQQAALDAQGGNNATAAKMYDRAAHQFKLAGMQVSELQNYASGDQLKAAIDVQDGKNAQAAKLYNLAGKDLTKVAVQDQSTSQSDYAQVSQDMASGSNPSQVQTTYNTAVADQNTSVSDTNQATQDFGSSDYIKASIAQQNGKDSRAAKLYFNTGNDLSKVGSTSQAQQAYQFAATDYVSQASAAGTANKLGLSAVDYNDAGKCYTDLSGLAGSNLTGTTYQAQANTEFQNAITADSNLSNNTLSAQKLAVTEFINNVNGDNFTAAQGNSTTITQDKVTERKAYNIAKQITNAAPQGTAARNNINQAKQNLHEARTNAKQDTISPAVEAAYTDATSDLSQANSLVSEFQADYNDNDNSDWNAWTGNPTAQTQAGMQSMFNQMQGLVTDVSNDVTTAQQAPTTSGNKLMYTQIQQLYSQIQSVQSGLTTWAQNNAHSGGGGM